MSDLIKVWDVGEVVQRWKRKLRSNVNERSVDGRRVYHYAGFWEDPKEKVSYKQAGNHKVPLQGDNSGCPMAYGTI